MIWTGGAKRRLKDVIGKKITNFSDVETKKEEALKTTMIEPGQPITDEELIPLFYFNLELQKAHQQQAEHRLSDQKLHKITLSRRLVEAAYEEELEEPYGAKQLTMIEEATYDMGSS